MSTLHIAFACPPLKSSFCRDHECCGVSVEHHGAGGRLPPEGWVLICSHTATAWSVYRLLLFIDTCSEKLLHTWLIEQCGCMLILNKGQLFAMKSNHVLLACGIFVFYRITLLSSYLFEVVSPTVVCYYDICSVSLSSLSSLQSAQTCYKASSGPSWLSSLSIPARTCWCVQLTSSCDWDCHIFAGCNILYWKTSCYAMNWIGLVSLRLCCGGKEPAYIKLCVARVCRFQTSRLLLSIDFFTDS